MWLPGLLGVVAVALDVTTLRQSYGPYALYNFMDGEQGSPGTARDLANHPLINFGNLTLGLRAQWLKGRPGVSLTRETSSTVTAAMSSVNNYQPSWASTFNNTPFVFEIWFQFTTGGAGPLLSIARHDTNNGMAGFCNVTEPLFVLSQDPSSLMLRSAMHDDYLYCYYSALPVRPRPALLATVALYGRFYATPTSKLESVWYQGTTQSTRMAMSSEVGLVWQDDQARLLFSSSNSASNLDYNLLSFAIYPNISNTEIASLFAAGLPNAKPFAPSFSRSVPETLGGSIQLCPNINATSRDSDCLDYTNNATHLGIGQTHSLVPSSGLAVWITSLPSVGVLSHMGSPILTVPFKLSANNSVYYTPVAETTSWWAQFLASQYTFNKSNNYTSFAYYVVDSDGAPSNTATVTLEVYPTHTAPVAEDVSDPVVAGRPLSASSFDNIIQLRVRNREFLSPGAGRQSCSGDSTTPMCTALADRPNPMQTVVTIKSLPCSSCGTLKVKNWNTGTFSDAAIGTQIVANRTWCGLVDCQTYWTVFWEAPLSMFNSTAEILGNVTFTYTATDTFDLAAPLGSTTHIVDAVGTTTSVNWQMTTESNVATATATIYNGFYAQSGISVVKQRNQTTIAPQRISLVATDSAVANPSITLIVTSLPARGGLFDVGSTTQITTVPHAVPSGSNFSLDYQPSLPTESFGFVSSPTYATFQFYAVSNSKQSNVATQTISVVDTNDAVRIEGYGPTNAGGEIAFAFSSGSVPQYWDDLPDNNMHINWTDPDVEVAGEPWYSIKLDTVASDFTIFLNTQYYAEIKALTGPSAGLLGLLVGPGSAGQGSMTWEVVVNRTLARLLLNPLRIRPNKALVASSLNVQIKDCIMVTSPPEFRTSSQFSSNPMDWSSLVTVAAIPLRGSAPSSAAPSPSAVAPSPDMVSAAATAEPFLHAAALALFLLGWAQL